jgi:hypothetical protein
VKHRPGAARRRFGLGTAMLIHIPVSAGELIDKITILRVKVERIDAAKKPNVVLELRLLEAILDRELPPSPELAALTGRLAEVNARLWDIEDGKRACERRGAFGADFVALARSVYIENDRRAAIKREINEITGSEIVEEKSYPDDEAAP